MAGPRVLYNRVSVGWTVLHVASVRILFAHLRPHMPRHSLSTSSRPALIITKSTNSELVAKGVLSVSLARSLSEMGVPRLRHHLQPYADRATLNGGKAVIDGPALAYYIHSLCITNTVKVPSCEALGQVCLEWLDEVTNHGLSMQVQTYHSTSIAHH